jgi:anaerobic dimethyl sulfoxide reductase subunit A
MAKAVEPMYECRNDIDIFAALATRLGIDGYNDQTEEAWLREFTAGTIDDFDAFRENGVARLPPPDDAVAFASFIRDPDRHPLATPSGRIEIYSTTLGEQPDPYGLGPISAIPTWVPPPEADARYPLALCSPKSRARTHSVHGNQPVLARIDADDLWIHPDDASPRGIRDGDPVRVLNDHGATLLPAKVTTRIAPGVVSIKEGAWFTPATDGTDTAGCANVLSADRSAACGATTYNTNRVEVERAALPPPP